MPKADPLIRTKIRLPLIRAGLVARPALQVRIDQGLHGPLTLITAPAGFGKTTLAASSVAGCGHPVAWLSLDKNDNQVGCFLNYLAAAVQAADASIVGEAVQLALAAPGAPPEAILTGLINDLDDAGTDIVLVLDDYHFISNPAVHAAVAFLVEHCPGALHLFMVSRSDPPLPLARLRARGQTVELRVADLSFSEPEAAQFLNEVMGLRLDAQAVAALEARTEGWIAGLQMAALSMRDRVDAQAFIEGFSGTHRYILDYLLEEVLTGLTPEIQRFLVRTSFLERLCAPLCDAILAGDEGQALAADAQATPLEAPVPQPSAAILEHLERANLFLVALDDERRWYRYHHLFADLLQSRLSQLDSAYVAQLHRRASAWCEQDGQVAVAASYALAAQDYGRVARLIGQHWQRMTNDGEIETVWAWLDALPEEMVRENALLSDIYCWTLWLTGQVAALEAHLVDAERALARLDATQQADKDQAAFANLPAELAALRSFVTRYHGDYAAACAHGERALGLIPADLPADDEAQLRAAVEMALATAYEGAGDLEKAAGAYAETVRWSRANANITGVTGTTYRLTGLLRLLGRLRAAEAACQDAMQYLQAQGCARVPAAGILYVALSEVLVEWNDLESAQAYLAQGIELGKWSGRLDAVRNAGYASSRLCLARGDFGGALAAIQAAESGLTNPPSPLAKAELRALRARVLAQQGALDEAAQCAEEAVRLAGRDRSQTGEMAALAAARVLFAGRAPEEVAAGLTPFLVAAESSGWAGSVIELRILRGLVQARQGDRRAAEADLECALALAEPQGYARIFLEEGQPMQQLLAEWLAHTSPGPLRDYAARLLAQFEAELHPASAEQEKTSQPGGLIDPLSPREIEVLQLIALGQTNQEIARQLIVSLGTVKAHTASIYRKLDVANRTEAVACARRLGILP